MAERPTIHDKLDEIKNDYKEDARETRKALKEIGEVMAAIVVRVDHNEKGIANLWKIYGILVVAGTALGTWLANN